MVLMRLLISGQTDINSQLNRHDLIVVHLDGMLYTEEALTLSGASLHLSIRQVGPLTPTDKSLGSDSSSIAHNAICFVPVGGECFGTSSGMVRG